MKNNVPLNPCPICQHVTGHVCTAYADEDVMVICLNCDASTLSYTMGIYEDGIKSAIKDWNNGKVYPYES